MTERTVVVLSIRDHKEFVSMQTSDGEVVVEVRPTGSRRSRVCIRAPRSVRIGRIAREPGREEDK